MNKYTFIEVERIKGSEVKVLVAQSCPPLSDPMDCSPPGPTVHGILQARVLEWVAMSVSRGTSQPRDQTWVSHIAGRFFTVWATREAIPKKKISFSERAYWAIQNILKALNKGCWLITSIRVPPWGLKVQPHFPLLLRRTNSPKTKLEAPRIRPLQVGRHLFERDIFCTCRCWKLGLFWRVVKCSWVRGRSKQLMCHQDLQQAVMLWLGMVLPAKEEM